MNFGSGIELVLLHPVLRHCERSAAIQKMGIQTLKKFLDCRVALLLAMTPSFLSGKLVTQNISYNPNPLLFG